MTSSACNENRAIRVNAISHIYLKGYIYHNRIGRNVRFVPDTEAIRVINRHTSGKLSIYRDRQL